uniref:Peptidase S1 domain-containing protein n=1 Tax=Clastoptera arizonana TaxID=38151 RepID=A0A1B6D719_9HEMI
MSSNRKMYFCFFILFLIHNGKGNLDNPENTTVHRRIIGGEEVKRIADYPFMAYILVHANSTHYSKCGGSVLGPRHVMTAAHCVTDCVLNLCHIFSARDILVFTGGVAPGYRGFWTKVITVIVHPSYSPIDLFERCHYNYDIAVLVLRSTLPLSDRISPVRLPEAVSLKDLDNSTTNKFAMAGTNCDIVGWGESEVNNFILRHATVPLCDASKCMDYIRQIKQTDPYGPSKFCLNTQICSMDTTNKSNICGGDSGGPILCNGIQVGITSYAFVKECAGSYNPGLYTRTDVCKKWIHEIMEISIDRSSISNTKFTLLLITVMLLAQLYLNCTIV